MYVVGQKTMYVVVVVNLVPKNRLARDWHTK